MAKVGIMGGTFDPIHQGHVKIAQAAYEQYNLDYVLFIPAGDPAHKKDKHVANAKDRLRMVQIAIRDYQHFIASDIEIMRQGFTYTLDTLKALHEQNKEDELYFIIGADSLFTIESWYHVDEVLAQCIMLVADRDDVPLKEFQQQIQYINKKYNADVRPLKTPMMHISSTDIRNALNDNQLDQEDVVEQTLLDMNVVQYIMEHQLYLQNGSSTITMEEQITSIKKKLKKKLVKDRYKHTLGVANTCVSLAMSIGYDYNKAYLAGLLHDCAKCIEDSEQLAKCEKYGLEISDIERISPYLLHAKLGAYLAEHKYNIHDEEILSAIRCHTTGKPAMTELELIVFIADYIEPNRYKAANLKEIRMLAYKDLEKCAYKILSDTLDYLKKKGAPIDTMTEKTYKYYKKKGV